MRDPILRFFTYEHLPPALQDISKPFCKVATWMDSDLPYNDETAAGLRKLLEAKDCAVRATIGIQPAKRPPATPPKPAPPGTIVE